MRILYYDCFAGISGDMNLGAMIDLGVDADYLVNELKKLGLNNEYEIKVGREIRKGIEGTKVDVILKGHDHSHDEEHNHVNLEEHCHEHHHHHEEEHCHDHHTHDHCHSHDHSQHQQMNNHHHHSSDHVHRNLKDIEDIINSSELSTNVKKISLNIFIKVAEAEAKVHGKPLYEVHFHEVGAIDSIVDIVGAAICLDYLKVDKIMASSIELGGGFVKCAHGLIPVPAPATVEILKGTPVKSGIVPFETTTPTGAAILAANVDEFTNNVDFIIEKAAYGVGGRDTEIPNVLRVYLGKKKTRELNEDDIENDEVYILQCNIDDMNPEIYNYTMEVLFNEGALDVYRTPILMKKDRFGVILNIMCREEDREKLKEIVFKETTSIGIREYKVKRTKLNRKFQGINTIYGEVKIKKSYYKDKLVNLKPEYDDCKKLAKDNCVSINSVYNEVYRNIEEEAKDE